MLKQETIDLLAGNSRLDAAKLVEAIKSEDEQAIEVNAFKVFTDEELTERLTNETTTAKQQSYNEGKDAALEMKAKDWKAKHGIDIDGKDLDQFLDAYTKKVSVKSDDNENLKTIEQLRTNILAKDTEIETLKTDYQKQIEGTQLESSVSNSIPNNLIDGWNRTDATKFYMASRKAEIVDGKIIIKDATGEIIKDEHLAKPITISEDTERFFKEKGLIKETKKGRGDKDQRETVTGLEGVTDKDTFFEYLSSNNINRTDRKVNEILAKLPKDVQEDILKRD